MGGNKRGTDIDVWCCTQVPQERFWRAPRHHTQQTKNRFRGIGHSAPSLMSNGTYVVIYVKEERRGRRPRTTTEASIETRHELVPAVGGRLKYVIL